MFQKNKWTGERLETFITNDAMLEHLHRYIISHELVKGLSVLDIACGEGYGTNLLAKSAKEITGIDIDENTIIHAQKTYTSKNLIFKKGSITNIPEPENKFDVIVCFETLEHIDEHEKALTELKRVLKQEGIIIISTPDKKYYSGIPNYHNPFHKKELYEHEFKSLITSFFKYSRYYSQRSLAASLILEEDENSIKTFFTGDYDSIKEQTSFYGVFKIAVASDNQIPDINTGLFFHKKNISTLLYDEAENVKKTKTYITGNLVLSPLKLIQSLFKK